jgi:hypothetical protein
MTHFVCITVNFLGQQTLEDCRIDTLSWERMPHLVTCDLFPSCPRVLSYLA